MSNKTTLTQGTIVLNERIDIWAKEFILDRKVRGLSPGTINFYKQKLKLFIDWCDAQIIINITDLHPKILRQYLIYLDERGHNAGGIHAAYRTLKAFLNWWEDEFEPEDWKNPVKKVKPPKQSITPIEGVDIANIKSLLETCESDKFTGLRDKAIILFLFDTGIRAGVLNSIAAKAVEMGDAKLALELLTESIRMSKNRMYKNSHGYWDIVSNLAQSGNARGAIFSWGAAKGTLSGELLAARNTGSSVPGGSDICVEWCLGDPPKLVGRTLLTASGVSGGSSGHDTPWVHW